MSGEGRGRGEGFSMIKSSKKFLQAWIQTYMHMRKASRIDDKQYTCYGHTSGE